MYAARPPGGAQPATRVLELIDALRAEVESLQAEAAAGRAARDEGEVRAALGQLADVGAMQRALHELQAAAVRARAHADDETARLRAALELARSRGFLSGEEVPSGGDASALASIRFPSAPLLEAELASFAGGFATAPQFSAGELPSAKRPAPPLPSAPAASFAASQPPAQSAPNAQSQITNQPPAQSGKGAAGIDWLVVYNPKAARELTIDLVATLAHDDVVCCLRFSPDGARLATGTNGAAAIYDARSGSRLALFSDTAGPSRGEAYVRSVAFSPNGRMLATASEDRVVRVWDADGEADGPVCRLSGHNHDIYAVDWSADGRFLFSGGGDGVIRVWDVARRECVRVLRFSDTDQPAEGDSSAREIGVTSVAVSPNGRFVAGGSLDRVARVWAASDDSDWASATETPVAELRGHTDAIYSVAWTPDGARLVSASLDRATRMWAFVSATDIASIDSPGDDTPDGPLPRCTAVVRSHKDFVLSVAVAPPSGRWVLTGSKDRAVQFWDAEAGSTQLVLQGHKNSVIAVAVAPTGNLFATGSGDHRARVWSFADARPPAQ